MHGMQHEMKLCGLILKPIQITSMELHAKTQNLNANKFILILIVNH